MITKGDRVRHATSGNEGIVVNVDGDSVKVRYDDGSITTNPSRAYRVVKSRTVSQEDLERQLELLALAIYDNKPNSLHNWAHDYLSLLKTVRGG